VSWQQAFRERDGTKDCPENQRSDAAPVFLIWADGGYRGEPHCLGGEQLFDGCSGSSSSDDLKGFRNDRRGLGGGKETFGMTESQSAVVERRLPNVRNESSEAWVLHFDQIDLMLKRPNHAKT